MDNRPQNVPISTLAGVSPLTDILPSLPLPSEDTSVLGLEHELAPLHVISNARSFLKSGVADPALLHYISEQLKTVQTNFLDFKDSEKIDRIRSPGHLSHSPALLRQLLSMYPDALSSAANVYEEQLAHPSHIPNGLQEAAAAAFNYDTQPCVEHSPMEFTSPNLPNYDMERQIIPPFESASSGPAVELASQSPVRSKAKHERQDLVSPRERTKVSLHTEKRKRKSVEKTSTSESGVSRPIADISQVRDHMSNLEKCQENELKAAVPEMLITERATCLPVDRLPGDLAAHVNGSDLQMDNPPSTGSHSVSHSAMAVPCATAASITSILPAGLSPQKVHGTPEQPLKLCVPKLVVKRTKTRRGSKEIEKLEIVSPPLEQPGCSHDDFVERPTSEKKKKKAKRKRSSMLLEEAEGSAKRKPHLSASTEQDAEVKKLNQIVDNLIDIEEELEADGNLEYDVDGEIPQDALMPASVISDFNVEIAKVKTSPLLKEVSGDKLMKVILVMDRHVRDSSTLLITQANPLEDDEERLWKSLLYERVGRSLEAASAILCITTAPDMPKQVCLEEAIENIISLCRFQLENTIYAEFDPVYRSNAENKDALVGSIKSRKSKGSIAKSRPVNSLYNKSCEVMSQLAELVAMEAFTDTTILQVSSIGTSPFFVENVNLLQLEALKLAQAVFRKYAKHRDIILDDVLASLARLPSSKRNLRNYRIGDDSNIQMFTALALQLVQCTVNVPETFDKLQDDVLDGFVDKDMAVINSYEDALRTAQNFLSMFLKKCGSTAKDESDFRPLFENFLQDLLTALNKPEWPSAEVFLTVLGKLLVVTFSNKSNDMSLRCASLDYLALIATHLRRDAVTSRDKEQDDIGEIIEKISDSLLPCGMDVAEDPAAFSSKIQKPLLVCLSTFEQNDASFKFSKEFFLAQWLRDTHLELEKCLKKPMLSIPGAANFDVTADTEEDSLEKIQVLEEKRSYLHSLVDTPTLAYRTSHAMLSYRETSTIVRYLASSRAFSQSFDVYLQQIFRILNEPAIALRTKAVKALTQIVSVDPNILARDEVQTTVHARLRDQSTNVREAAVDLIGQFVLKCPELINKYYDMIVERILDTGISVRKRVIKILRDICLEQPEFSKIPDICIKIIRRINDEEGVKELVAKVFLKIWFTPIEDVNSTAGKEVLDYRVQNISEVVNMCKDTGYEWFETLLDIILDVDEEATKKTLLGACQQLVNCLLNKLMVSDEQKGSTAIVGSLTTLYLLCKVRPHLLVQHAVTLQPYLSIKCNTQGDVLIIQNVAQILELVVPLIDHPNEEFLAELEEAMMKLILKQGQNVVQSCISCLAALVNNVTHNYKFVLDCFQKFFAFLSKCQHDQTAGKLDMKAVRAPLMRSLFTIGLLCKHFDLDLCVPNQGKVTASEKVSAVCLHFATHRDEEVRLKALMAIGFIGIRLPEVLLKDECKALYQSALTSPTCSVKEKCMILKNLGNHLIEEEAKLRKDDPCGDKKKKDRRKKNKDEELSNNIKEFGDTHSGTTSAVMQSLLKNILEAFFHAELMVRLSALQVIASILRQGLIHPAQCVPYLIAISCDDEQIVQFKAQQNLADIENRYNSFISMKALQGVKLAYKFRALIKDSKKSLRGFRDEENRLALINQVYDMLKTNKQQRRSFLISVLKMVDDKASSTGLLHFVAENLAYLGYTAQEEALFVIHRIDVIASVSGANLLQNFEELAGCSPLPQSPEAAEMQAGLNIIDNDTNFDDVELDDLRRVVCAAYGCMMLLELKKFLKQLFGLQDSKCQKYSPSEPSKLYDKAMTRRGYPVFNSTVTELLTQESDVTRQQAVSFHSEFREVMLTLDAEHDSDSSNEKEPTPATEPPPRGLPRCEAVLPDDQTLSTNEQPDVDTAQQQTPPVVKAKKKKPTHRRPSKE